MSRIATRPPRPARYFFQRTIFCVALGQSFVVIWESSFQTSIGKNHFKVDLQSPFGAVGAVCGHIFNRHSRILTSQLHPLQLEL